VACRSWEKVCHGQRDVARGGVGVLSGCDKGNGGWDGLDGRERDGE